MGGVAEGDRGVLAAVGGVVDHAAGRPSPFDGHDKGVDGELGRAALADRPTDHAARVEIEDPGEVKLALLRLKLG